MFRKEFQKAIKNTISKYKTIVFGADTLICTKCLNELRNQQVIDQIVYRKKLIERTVGTLARNNVVADGEMIIGKSII